MGPWFHGGWDRCYGERVGNIHFGARTSVFYRAQIELPFFNHFLKDKGELRLPEAYMFETGANQWRSFDHWPPDNVQTRRLHLRADGALSFEAPAERGAPFDEYVSDPARPVPYIEDITTDTPRSFLTDDQRFAARRPDVLVYQTEPLLEAITLAGPSMANLWVSTSGTDSDWVVKLIDVFPDDAPDHRDGDACGPTKPLGGYQMLVRAEVLRGRFRNSYEHPEPFVPDEPTSVSFELLDILHTFGRGHRIMFQVQSSWFPLIDRNPQKYVDNIFMADEEDFIKSRQRVFRSRVYPTHLQVHVLDSD
jgi:putative CocE/NonD family hydrolase